MRYSITKGEPGFKELDALIKRGATLNVFFRDKLQTDCVIADDVEGMVVRYTRFNGKLITERGKIRTIKLQGKVRFEIVEKQTS